MRVAYVSRKFFTCNERVRTRVSVRGGERWIDLARGDAREVPPKRHTRHRVAPVGVHAAAEHDIACGSGSGEGEDEAVRKSSRVARGAGCGFAGPPL
jgi:hypothetical protein